MMVAGIAQRTAGNSALIAGNSVRTHRGFCPIKDLVNLAGGMAILPRKRD
jgi:hypothetical protein